MQNTLKDSEVKQEKPHKLWNKYQKRRL